MIHTLFLYNKPAARLWQQIQLDNEWTELQGRVCDKPWHTWKAMRDFRTLCALPGRPSGEVGFRSMKQVQLERNRQKSGSADLGINPRPFSQEPAVIRGHTTGPPSLSKHTIRAFRIYISCQNNLASPASHRHFALQQHALRSRNSLLHSFWSTTFPA